MSNDFEQEDGSANVVNRVSPREMLMRYVHFLPWFLLSVAVALTLAFLNLRYSSRVYNVTGNLLIKDPNPYASAGGGKFDDIFFGQPDRSLNDEMQIIHSRTMAKRVVKKLELQTMYFAEGKVRSSMIYKNESPFALDILQLKDTTRGFTLSINVKDDNSFTIGKNTQTIIFGQVFEIAVGSFRLNRTNDILSVFASKSFTINWLPEEKRAIQLLGGLKLGLSGDASNILSLTFETENPRSGVDIVNTFMDEYKKAGFEENKDVAKGALDFINDQLDSIRSKLGGVETDLRKFREKNKIYNPEQQSTIVFGEVSEMENRITDQAVKLKLVDFLVNYLNDDRNLYRLGMSTLGLEEPILVAQIGEFNKLQVQRETLLKTTLPGNPMIGDLEAGIIKLKGDILSNLNSIRQTNLAILNDMTSKSRKASDEIALIPDKEQRLLDKTRNQKIFEELFSYLLQKKLETSIGSASTMPNSRVIETALASGVPVKPNARTIYLTAFLLGLAIPAGIIFLIEFLNDKVRSREDIEKATSAPILGEIGHAHDKQTLIVTKASRKFIAEQFRIIRTNLQYVLPKTDKPVILVTSSFSGEGKSFISVNIGAAIALTGKKTVVLEFDIRKPKISQNLKLEQKTGISNYIIGKSDFRDLAVAVPNVDNLFVVPCGPIPPNPAELLLSERLDQLFAELKRSFDVVIIDTAPVGLVSDAITLGKFADITLYILRHNYTFKKQLRMIDELYVQKRLPKLALIINDIDVQRGYGNYHSLGGYGTGYGYGYGYGNGNTGYYEPESAGKNWIGKIKRLIRF